MSEPGAVALAESVLAEARRTGDRRREALALIDLGILAAQGNQPGHSQLRLEEAVAVAHQLGDPQLEGEALGELGLTAADSGNVDRGLEAVAQSLELARKAGDQFGEKSALVRLGNLHAGRREPELALERYRQGLRLARTLGDRADEADTHWLIAMLFADHGNRGRAVAEGQAAVRLFQDLGHPHADALGSALQSYERGAADSLAALHAPVIAAAGFPMGPPPAEPGLLRMAWTAAKSVARFVGSGLRTVSAERRQERLQVCASCPHHTGLRCRLCGCFTTVKAKLPHERCPAGKWPD